MNIGQIFDWTSYISSKSQSGSISPEEFNLSCEVVSRELFNLKVGIPEEYLVGAPYARQAYQVTQKITDDMRYFINDVDINKSNGFFPLPTDYAAFSSLGYKYVLNNPNGGQPVSEERNIDVMSDGELSVRLYDNVIFPTLRYPCAAYREKGILVYPKEIKKVSLTYLRYPAIPFFNYSVVNDEYVYKPIGSVQVDFPETLHAQFAVMIARYVGVTLHDNELYAMMQERLKAGQ